MEDLTNKYRLNLNVVDIENVYNDFREINKVVRYESKLEDVVDGYLEGIVYLNRLNSDIKGIQLEINKVRERLSRLRRSGIENLKMKGELVKYLECLDKSERNILIMKDLGLNDILGEIDRVEFRNNRISKNYL
jgi:hypothetical protein